MLLSEATVACSSDYHLEELIIYTDAINMLVSLQRTIICSAFWNELEFNSYKAAATELMGFPHHI